MLSKLLPKLCWEPILRQCLEPMRIVLNEIYVQGGMRKLEQAEFDKAKEKKANEKQKALMHSLFASLTAVKKVDAEGNSK